MSERILLLIIGFGLGTLVFSALATILAATSADGCWPQ